MNLASPETKVGLFTIIALVAVSSLFVWLSGIRIFDKGSEIEAIFDHVEGLRPGATVEFAGVDIGRVSRIYFEGYRVVVVMRIRPGIKVPRPAKVFISSSGVIGDKFLEIIPTKPGELALKGKRLIGQTPVTTDQFYATAYDVLESLRTVADSIKYFISDPEIATSLKNALVRLDYITADLSKITGQLQKVDMVEIFGRINHISLLVEQMAETNQPQLNDFMANIAKVSAQLTEITITANRFLKDFDNNGQTAANLRQTLANADKISADLEKFTTILADNDQDIGALIKNANETMQAIKTAADSLTKAIDQLATGDGSLSKVNETITQTNLAAKKVNSYMETLDKISLKNSLGAEYQENSPLIVDYKLDLSFDERNAILLGWNDIGESNLASLQWAFKTPNYIGRVGLYKNKLGLGLDIPISSRLLLGMDLWDVNSPNVGVNSNWQISPLWTLSLSDESNLDIKENTWNFELWRNF